MSIAAIKELFTAKTNLQANRENVIHTFPYFAELDLNFGTKQTWELVNQALDLIPEVQKQEKISVVNYGKSDNTEKHDLQRSLTFTNNGKTLYIRDQSEITTIEDKIKSIFADLISEKNNKNDNADIHKFLVNTTLPTVIKNVELITQAKINENGRRKGFYKAQGKLKTLPKSCDNQENMRLNQAKADQIEFVSIFDNNWSTLENLIKLSINGLVIYNTGEKLKSIEKNITKLESQAIESKKRSLTAQSKIIVQKNVVMGEKSIPMVIKLDKNRDSYLRKFADGEMLSGKLILSKNGSLFWENAIGHIKPIKIGEIQRIKQDKLIWYDNTADKYADLLNQNRINDCKVKLHTDHGYSPFGIIFRGYDAIYKGKIIAKAKIKPYFVQKLIWLTKIEIMIAKNDLTYGEMLSIKNDAIEKYSHMFDEKNHNKIMDLINDEVKKQKNKYSYYVKHDITSVFRANQTLIANTAINKLINDAPNKIKQKDFNDFLRGLKKLLAYVKPTYSEKNIATVSYLLLDRFQGEAREALNYILPAIAYIKGKHDDSALYTKITQEINSII
jgi:hypothetical protein